MTSRYVLTHSIDGIAQAKQKIARAKLTGANQSELKADIAFDALGPGLRVMKKGGRPGQPAPRHVVGIWSLEAWLAGLGGLIDALNKAQSTFVFYEVDAAVPAGLISRPERVAAWFKEGTGRKPSRHIREHLEDNLIADDFFGLAENIRTDLMLDYIIGVTPSMVAGIDGTQLYWNYFSTFDRRTVLASSYQLHEFARDTGWPLEAFLGKIIVSQLLVAVMWPGLGFHPDNSCLFDFEESRVSLKDKVKDPHIEPDCLKKMKPAYRPAARAFVDLLRSYGGAK
jgi:hypothetical protein